MFKPQESSNGLLSRVADSIVDGAKAVKRKVRGISAATALSAVAAIGGGTVVGACLLDTSGDCEQFDENGKCITSSSSSGGGDVGGGGSGGENVGGSGGSGGKNVGGSGGGTGGVAEGGGGTGPGGSGGGGSMNVVVDPDLSTLELVSPTAAEITNEIVGVEADGVKTGLFVATIIDEDNNVVPNRTVQLAKTSGPGVPVITAVECQPGDTPGVTNAMGEACFEASLQHVYGTDQFAAKETTSTPDVDINDTVSLTFCYGVDINNTGNNVKVFTDASCLNSIPLQTVPEEFCLVPPFEITVNTSDIPNSHHLLAYMTEPADEVRVRSLGTTAPVNDVQHDLSCTMPMAGSDNVAVDPVGDNLDVPPNYELEDPGTIDQGAMWYIKVN